MKISRRFSQIAQIYIMDKNKSVLICEICVNLREKRPIEISEKKRDAKFAAINIIWGRMPT